MLTIFSIPKPFVGQSALIQRNAIQSWLKLEPRCEIFLCGNDSGVAEAAQEFHVHHLPDIQKNEYDTPVLGSAFRLVQQIAGGALVCYVNADIILLNDVLEAVGLVSFPRFLLLGQRWNLEVNDSIDFLNPLWEKELRTKLSAQGELQPPFGSDYFIFQKDIMWNFPEFTVGRPGWDNWIIYRARILQMPVIDVTKAATVVHQNHNYTHVPGGITPASFEGPEAVQNRSMMGGEDYSFNLRDVTHHLMGNSLQKATDFPHLQYRLRRQPVLNVVAGPLRKLLWKVLSALLYRRQYFPAWFWQNAIYTLTK